ncbi:MAG: FAD-dependent oxidoreductase [Elusimicrobia bacterium]|nr:FAD-dependent oxidoreductase [Elusimicrobiota bacterium]
MSWILSVLVFPFLSHPHLIHSQETFFKGESCTQCHSQIRDVAQPPRLDLETSESYEEYDIIIVGGGLSGLTAAYTLRDLKVLLLEKEDRVGGKVRRESWGKDRYPVAAGYISDLYLDIMKEMFRDLGLETRPIPEPTNSLFTASGTIIHDPFGKGLSQLPESDEVKETIRRMIRDIQLLLKDNGLGELPPIPAPNRMSALHKRLDRISFFDYMNQKYGTKIAEFVDGYSLSIFGIAAKQVSALTGLVFFVADFGGADNITWEGGTGIISEKLAERIGMKRIETDAVVTAVSQDSNGVWVVYKKGENRYTRRAKMVVMATPSFVSKHLILGLPGWKKEALSKVRYSAYAMALIATNEILYEDSFDLWSGIKTIFTDLSPTGWILKNRGSVSSGSPAQILQAFIPLGERQGRSFLESTSDEELARTVTSDMEKIFPGAASKIHGIRIIRWGHAMPVDYPGYLTQVRMQVAKPVGRVFFASADTEMPCIEGAIVSGHRAAQEVRQLLKKGFVQ